MNFSCLPKQDQYLIDGMPLQPIVGEDGSQKWTTCYFRYPVDKDRQLARLEVACQNYSPICQRGENRKSYFRFRMAVFAPLHYKGAAVTSFEVTFYSKPDDDGKSYIFDFASVSGEEGMVSVSLGTEQCLVPSISRTNSLLFAANAVFADIIYFLLHND